jgi:adenosylhomocysteine nucleosidase
MKILLVIPIREEIYAFLQACTEHGVETIETKIGKLPVVCIPGLDLTLAEGGLGKVQFAVQTQYLTDTCTDWDLIICAGTAGALVNDLSIGDVVVASETVEHDIHNKFGDPLIPRFTSPAMIVDDLKGVQLPTNVIKIHFGAIASGDEDVVAAERRNDLHQQTGALAVAWEGAGGARACKFNDVPFVEIRGITDGTDFNAAESFRSNLEIAMRSVALLILAWLEKQ